MTSTSQTEAQTFFEETYPFPVVLVALASLAIGDVAIAFSMVLAMA